MKSKLDLKRKDTSPIILPNSQRTMHCVMIIMQGDDICCIKVFLFLSDELYQNYFKQVKWINNTLIY